MHIECCARYPEARPRRAHSLLNHKLRQTGLKPLFICMQLLGLSLRPLIKHANALADRQPDAGPVLDRTLEDATRLVQAIPSEQQFLDPLTVSAPLFSTL